MVYARPNGHGVLFLSDQRVVDAATGGVFPVGALTTLSIDVARSSLEGDRVCVVRTDQSPFEGGCFALAFGAYGAPDVNRGPVSTLSGFDVAGAGFATDLATTANGLSAIVGVVSNVRPAVRFSVLGQFQGAAMSDEPVPTLRTARAVATGPIGAIYVDVREDATGNERLDRFNVDGSFLLRSFPFPNASVTGMPAQLVVTGDGVGAAYLTGVPQSSVSTHLNFQRSY